MTSVKEITNGDIIRLSHDNDRDWVAIHHSRCSDKHSYKTRKHVKDDTGFYLFSGLWYEGDVTTDAPYGKCAGKLTRGMFAHISVVGNIQNKNDYKKYKEGNGFFKNSKAE